MLDTLFAQNCLVKVNLKIMYFEIYAIWSNIDFEKLTEIQKERLLKYDQIDQTNVEEKYDNVAEEYEKTCMLLGYPDPEKVVEAMVKYKIPKDTPIIDFGWGTGYVGEELQKEG